MTTEHYDRQDGERPPSQDRPAVIPILGKNIPVVLVAGMVIIPPLGAIIGNIHAETFISQSGGIHQFLGTLIPLDIPTINQLQAALEPHLGLLLTTAIILSVEIIHRV